MGVYVCIIASQPGEKRTIDYVTLTFYSLSFPASRAIRPAGAFLAPTYFRPSGAAG